MNNQTSLDVPGRTGSRGRSLLVLLAFVILVAVASATASSVTLPQIGGWYAGLEKPWFNPPNWLFGPVWSALYAMMAIAGWLVWRERGLKGARGALALFGLQLALNILWSLIFFGLESPERPSWRSSALWLAVAATAGRVPAHQAAGGVAVRAVSALGQLCGGAEWGGVVVERMNWGVLAADDLCVVK